METTAFMGCVVYVVSTLLTYFGGLISKKKGWNEEVPIPIQNIGIAFISFIIILITNLIFKLNVNIQDIVIYLITAFGGAGTATLSYDTTKISTEKLEEQTNFNTDKLDELLEEGDVENVIQDENE